MANGSPPGGRSGTVSRTKASGAVRLFSRLAASIFALVIITLVSVQFARIVNEDIAMANSLSSVQGDIRDLQAHNRRERREIRRLMDPEGAIPEIHDRLHLVQPGEAIIYLKPAPREGP